MTRPEHEQDRWEPCPPGALTRTVRQLQARGRDRRRAKWVGLAGSVIILLVAATMIAQQFVPSPGEGPQLQAITCARVKQLLPAYFAGKLETQVMGQIETHLDECPNCRQRYQKARDDTARAAGKLSGAPKLAVRF